MPRVDPATTPLPPPTLPLIFADPIHMASAPDPADPRSVPQVLGRRALLQRVGVLAASALTGTSLRAASRPAAPVAGAAFPLLPGFVPGEDDDAVTPPFPGDPG